MLEVFIVTECILFHALGADQRTGVSMVAIAVGSVCGALIICLLSVVAVIAVVAYFKHKLKVFNLTSNAAYTSQGRNVTNHNHDSSQDIEILATQPTPYYDTIEDDIVDLAHVDLQNLSGGTATVNLVQNAAYTPLATLNLPLSQNVAYESHMHQDTQDDEDKYDYVD